MSELAKSLLSDGLPPLRRGCEVEISIPELNEPDTQAISASLVLIRDTVREMYLYGVEIPAILEEVGAMVAENWYAELHSVQLEDTCSLQLIIRRDELIDA